MPVLIEGVSVLIKKGSIYERYQGGYGRFVYDLQDQASLCESDHLVRIGFDTHELARQYLQLLVARGLKIMLLNEENPNNTDAMLVDQVFGPSFRVYWLDFIHLDANPDTTQNNKTNRKKTQDRISESITIAATDEEVVIKEEVRVIGWSKDEIAFPSEWEYRKSKSMELEFMRMAENRSSLTH